MKVYSLFFGMLVLSFVRIRILRCPLFVVVYLLLPSIAPTSLFAQYQVFRSGGMLLDGNFSFSSNIDDDISSFAISVGGQYFVFQGLAVGGNVNWDVVFFEGESFGLTGAGPSISYYLNTTSETSNFFPFFNAGISWFAGNAVSDFSRLKVKGGGLIMLTDRAGIDVAMQYEVSYEIEIERVVRVVGGFVYFFK